jgi:ABC-2 type transport system permease protein
MSNIIAIAQKELKSYFASPIGYIILGMFSLLYGYFFYALLAYFSRQSTSMNQFGANGQTLNINQDMIRLLMQNVTIIALFIMPMLTMRTYAEEKRSGTIELLLTSPLTDFQIIMGKFLGSLALWAAALAVSLIHIGLLFIYGRPEWRPLVACYLGLLLFGGCFISIGLFISSLTKNQIVAGITTFAAILFLWIISWVSSFGGPTFQKVTEYMSVITHFDDFSKGVIDTTHVVYYLSLITLGLFLTAKSVDSERWRG